MPRLSYSIASALLITTAMPSAAQATDYMTASLGLFDIDKDEATQFGLEYRAEPLKYGFRPMVGVDVTTDGSFYGYGGVAWDVALIDDQLYLIPTFAAGGYSQGSGKDLGNGLEFRSGIEMSYQLPNTHRVGVALHHISNASIGDKNPGAETLLINYSIPASTIFGR